MCADGLSRRVGRMFEVLGSGTMGAEVIEYSGDDVSGDFSFDFGSVLVFAGMVSCEQGLTLGVSGNDAWSSDPDPEALDLPSV